MIVLLFDFFEPGRRDKGKGEGCDMVDLDNDTLALLDASDGACTACEVALGDAYTLTWLVEELFIIL